MISLLFSSNCWAFSPFFFISSKLSLLLNFYFSCELSFYSCISCLWSIGSFVIVSLSVSSVLIWLCEEMVLLSNLRVFSSWMRKFQKILRRVFLILGLERQSPISYWRRLLKASFRIWSLFRKDSFGGKSVHWICWNFILSDSWSALNSLYLLLA